MNQKTVVLENARSCLVRQRQRKKKERPVRPRHCYSLAWLSHWHVPLVTVGHCYSLAWLSHWHVPLVTVGHCYSLAWLSHWHVPLVTVGWSSLRMPSGPQPRYQHTPGPSCCPGPPQHPAPEWPPRGSVHTCWINNWASPQDWEAT